MQIVVNYIANYKQGSEALKLGLFLLLKVIFFHSLTDKVGKEKNVITTLCTE